MREYNISVPDLNCGRFNDPAHPDISSYAVGDLLRLSKRALAERASETWPSLAMLDALRKRGLLTPPTREIAEAAAAVPRAGAGAAAGAGVRANSGASGGIPPAGLSLAPPPPQGQHDKDAYILTPTETSDYRNMLLRHQQKR